MRTFYTSLGHPGIFNLPQFRLLLANAVYSALRLPTPGGLVSGVKPFVSRSKGAGRAKPAGCVEASPV